MKLYELTSEMAAKIAAYNAAETDEEQSAALAELDLVDQAFEAKMEQCAFVVADYESDADVIEAEAKRLAERAAAMRARAKSLKSYMVGALEGSGLPTPKVTTARYTIWAQKAQPAVNIADEVEIETLPESCRVLVPATWKADKKAILEAVKAGIVLPGVTISQSSFLRIK